MFKIRDKILVTFLPVVIVPLLIAGAFFCFYTINYVKQNKSGEISRETGKKSERVLENLRSVERDTLLLGRNRAVFDLIDAVDSEYIGQIDYPRTQLENAFKEFLESRGKYYQIRYINESGMEIVRVVLEHEEISIVPPGELGDRSQSSCVKEMLNLKDGDVYVSAPGLDREDGSIKIPHKPVIIYATPVFDNSGFPRGGVVLSLRVESQLLPILKQKLNEEADTFLIDRDGSYLVHTDVGKCWGGQHDLNSNENLKNDFPEEISSRIMSGGSGDVLVGGQYYNYAPIFFDPANKGRFWVLVEGFPETVVFSTVYVFFTWFGIISSIMIAGVIATVFIFSRRLTRSLRQLINGVTKIAETDSDYQIPVTSNDEIAFLCFSFNKVLYKLKKAHKQLLDYADNLEEKIEIKTVEIFGKAKQQKVVAEIGKMFWANEDLDETLDKVVRLVARTMSIGFCNILLRDKTQPCFYQASGVGWEDDSECHTRVGVDVGTMAGYTLKEQKTIVVKDLRTETRFSVSPLIIGHGIVSGLSVALIEKERAVGVMGVYSKDEITFSKSDINFMESVGQIVAAAIDRKYAEEEIVRGKEFTDNLIETAQDAIVCIDEKGIVTIWNRAAEEIFGYSNEEIVGQQILTIIPGRYKKDHIKGMELFMETNKTRIIGKTVEVNGLKKDGNEVPIDMSLSFQKLDNEKYIFIAIIRDRSFQNEIKKKLHENSKNLMKANKELGEFVYIISHDLKEPLFAIDGYISRLSKVCGDALDDRGRRYVNRISVNTELMSKRIHELLEVIKVGMVVYVFADYSSKIIISGIVNELESLLERERVSLSVQDDLPTVLCDKKRLKDVFWNLITNAIKFMGEDDDRQVRIGCERENGHYKFFVEDTGIGIKGEYHDQIFQIFRRLKDIETEGTGVGLAIVKKIVGIHHGKLWVESPVHDGRGTKVCFTIPVKKGR